eukprot:2397992-Pyramimonas_sp.AAC.1
MASAGLPSMQAATRGHAILCRSRTWSYASATALSSTPCATHGPKASGDQRAAIEASLTSSSVSSV